MYQNGNSHNTWAKACAYPSPILEYRLQTLCHRTHLAGYEYDFVFRTRGYTPMAIGREFFKCLLTGTIVPPA